MRRSRSPPPNLLPFFFLPLCYYLFFLLLLLLGWLLSGKEKKRSNLSSPEPDGMMMTTTTNGFLQTQVHITLGNQDGTAMMVSWVTPNELGSSTVMYGGAPGKLDLRAHGTHTRYDYFNYTSGFIHHCTLKNLKVRPRFASSVD
jgi:hypothetical protein